MSVLSPQDRTAFRRARTRKKIFGTAARPRLSVYRSSKHIYAQLVDDAAGRTLAAASSLEKTIRTEKGGAGVAAAQSVGVALGEKAKALKMDKVVFDRGGRPYHGRIRAVAEGARAAGLIF
jgi:large subunit ribosomal protein L18